MFKTGHHNATREPLAACARHMCGLRKMIVKVIKRWPSSLAVATVRLTVIIIIKEWLLA
jgi:hypothetical protein